MRREIEFKIGTQNISSLDKKEIEKTEKFMDEANRRDRKKQGKI